VALAFLAVLTVRAGFDNFLNAALVVARHHVQAVTKGLPRGAHVVDAIGFEAVLVIRTLFGALALDTLPSVFVADHVHGLAVQIRCTDEQLMASVVCTTDLPVGTVLVADADYANSLFLVANKVAETVFCGVARCRNTLALVRAYLQLEPARTTITFASIRSALSHFAIGRANLLASIHCLRGSNRVSHVDRTRGLVVPPTAEEEDSLSVISLFEGEASTLSGGCAAA